jgi:TonB family protein
VFAAAASITGASRAVAGQNPAPAASSEAGEASALLDTARMLFNKRQNREALTAASRSLDLFEKERGKEDEAVALVLMLKDPAMAELLEDCACSLAQLKRGSEAESLRSRAYAIRYPADGPRDHRQYVPGFVLQGEAILRVVPSYPRAALLSRLAGAVVVEVLISQAGVVESAKVVCGPDLLAEAARKAAEGWRFKPTLLRGRPLKVIGTITFNFAL